MPLPTFIQYRRHLLILIGLVSYVIAWTVWLLPQQFYIGSFSTPILPLLISIIKPFSSIVIKQPVVFLIIISIVFGAITHYLLTYELTKNQTISCLSAFIFASPLSFSGLTMYQFGLFLGDGAHIFSISFLTLVSYSLLKFIRSGKVKWFIITSLGVALVGLTSPFGWLNLSIFMLVLTFSEMLLGLGRTKIIRTILTWLTGLGLTSFWYNPSFIKLIMTSTRGEEVWQIGLNLIPIFIVITPLLLVFGFLFFERHHHLQPIFVSLFLAIIYILIYFSGKLGNQFLQLEPERFLPELGFSLSFALSIVVVNLGRWFKHYNQFFIWSLPVRQGDKRQFIYGALISFALTVLIAMNLWNFSVSNYNAKNLNTLSEYQNTGLVNISLNHSVSNFAKVIGILISISSVTLCWYLIKIASNKRLLN